MKRRLFLLAPLLAPLVAGACSLLPDRPYPQKRDWPLTVRRPEVPPPRAGGHTLLVRSVTAAPGLEERGLRTLQPDGSLRVAYYEQWITPPAAGVEESLRRWLAASGLFAAVLAPGSRADADFVLEGELTALWSEPAAHRATAGLAFALLDQRHGDATVLTQQSVTGAAPQVKPDAVASVEAQRAALAAAFAQVERALAAFA